MTSTIDQPYTDGYWDSADGLRLHFRDYPGDAAALPVLCLPGLTRNARDFAALAEALAGPRRLLALDFRGRGDSDYAKDWSTYAPATYAADVLALLDQQGMERFVSIGTSLGGIVTSLIAAQAPERLAGAVLNDIGPELEEAGRLRIMDYLGTGGSFPTWVHAARHLADQHGDVHPGWDLEGWLAYAKRVMAIGPGGRIAFDYDMKIAEPFRTAPDGPPPDMWPAFEALGGRPLVLVRGSQSDLLSRATAAQMQQRIAGLELVEIEGVGHAPTLDEPQACAAIAQLLEKAK